MILNDGRDVLDIDSYVITSDTGGVGSLDPSWTGLAGWSNGGASDELMLSDFNLASSTVFNTNDSAALGQVFDTSVGNEDLQFSYTDSTTGQSIVGDVRYVTGSTDDADFDGDGDVDGDDFLSWQAGFGAAGGLAQGDANGSGNVDGVDFGIWEDQYGTGSGPGSLGSAAVPEPSSIVILLLGFIALGKLRKSVC